MSASIAASASRLPPSCFAVSLHQSTKVIERAKTAVFARSAETSNIGSVKLSRSLCLYAMPSLSAAYSVLYTATLCGGFVASACVHCGSNLEPRARETSSEMPQVAQHGGCKPVSASKRNLDTRLRVNRLADV